ncbi:hypothetical protein PUNSTDRAFT_145746 [Punctularia strigosozonata HHB-11173 SS5]|uniref:uncharacterized protein n=1 Tax=Punctularia strigosozonata (strain HHB-11173) TaxID=741275 RepID=UPI0004418474|nr:uncharacterized protein PUNSTDRAFT_145746 [Punctularia strigosozonata HHB-11173 SS5]EIN05840.1 hypothetical protein PUNSTDRAFT_145746 [Punctularia strigosozonata HHB-11173 SS5]
MSFPLLAEACAHYPAIDDHGKASPATYRDSVPFEGLISEAEGDALLNDAPHTISCFRAAKELAPLFKLPDGASWDSVKAARQKIPYDELVQLSMHRTGIQCLLLDDGLGGVQEMCEDYKWHDQFTRSATKRIVRVEIVAQDLLKDLLDAQHVTSSSTGFDCAALFESLEAKFAASIAASAEDPEVAGFKSVACYRGGLAISPAVDPAGIAAALGTVIGTYLEDPSKPIRLAHKPLNDWIVVTTCKIAAKCGKPIQFHTGLGDNDIVLNLSSPSHMQPLIKAFPETKFVLLHSSYPYTREAGYLSAVYANVYLDFGEIFPFVSADGQREVVRQMLELCPTNKILWSTDGHWWPESFYLGTQQARDTLYEVLADYVVRKELTEGQAVTVVENALFHNSNRLYRLGLTPDLSWKNVQTY